MVAAVALASGIAPASGESQDALLARVQAAYNVQCNDLIANDFTSFEKTLSPNFSASVNGQTVTRNYIVTQLRGFAAQGRVTKCTTTIASVQESSNVVIAVVNQQLDGTLSDGTHTAPVEIDAGKRDMWSDVAGALEQTTSVSLWTLTYVNGELKGQSGTPPSTPPLSLPTSSPEP